LESDGSNNLLSTFLNVKAMVTDILKAREELTKMPDKTKSLLNLVDCADKSLEKLRPAASALAGSEAEAGMIQSPDQDNKNELLCPFLNSLGEELLRAHGKLERVQRKSDDVAARNKVRETGLFRAGCRTKEPQRFVIASGAYCIT
jgi:hypothetical protein